ETIGRKSSFILPTKRDVGISIGGLIAGVILSGLVCFFFCKKSTSSNVNHSDYQKVETPLGIVVHEKMSSKDVDDDNEDNINSVGERYTDRKISQETDEMNNNSDTSGSNSSATSTNHSRTSLK